MAELQLARRTNPEASEAVCVRRFGPGEEVSDPQPGDFILVRENTWYSRLIYWFARLRFRGRGERGFAHWSHVALVGHHDGRIIEVLDTGVQIRHLGKYRDCEYHYVGLALRPEQRGEVVDFARGAVGQPYGRLGFVILGFSLLTGGLIKVRDRGQQGCAALVVRALAHCGERFEMSPVEMMPGDLARHYGIRP